MVEAVQRPRGPMGWSLEYAHLGWPSDTTPEQRGRWHAQYEIERRTMRETCLDPADVLGAPVRSPEPPQMHPSCATGPATRTRYRLGWRGCLVLQIQYAYGNRIAAGNRMGQIAGPYSGWRDATIEDLQRLYEAGQDPVPDGSGPTIPQPRPVGGSR